MTSKKINKASGNKIKIFIERILIDPRDGACFVVMIDPASLAQSIFEMNRYNVQFYSSGSPTKFFFDVKDNEKMWIRIDDSAPLILLEVGLRSPDNIEFLSKK